MFSLMSSNLSYPPLAPYLVVNGAARAIEFYKKAFGAEERYRLIDPDSGRIGHAEITIRGMLLMLSDEYPSFKQSPSTLGATTIKLCLMTEQVDADFARAIEAGAEVVFELKDQFYGFREGRLRDPFGHEWTLSQEIENISPQEMQRRWTEMSAKDKSSIS
jgi:PhnB protein